MSNGLLIFHTFFFARSYLMWLVLKLSVAGTLQILRFIPSFGISMCKFSLSTCLSFVACSTDFNANSMSYSIKPQKVKKNDGKSYSACDKNPNICAIKSRDTSCVWNIKFPCYRLYWCRRKHTFDRHFRGCKTLLVVVIYIFSISVFLLEKRFDWMDFARSLDLRCCFFLLLLFTMCIRYLAQFGFVESIDAYSSSS